MKSPARPLSRSILPAVASLFAAVSIPSASWAEDLTILHIGDQESWLLSAQGNLRDDPSQLISYYGGVDRLAKVISNTQTAAQGAGRTVLKLNAGDSLLPGPRFTASLNNLATAYGDGGQDFYDAIALRAMDFDAVVFGNHEFDLGVATAARFANVSETSYLSTNLDFTQHPDLNALLTAGKVGASKVITTPGGKKIGIVGVTTPLLPSISSPQTLALMDGFAGFSQANTELQNLQALLPVVQAEIDSLRAPVINGGEGVHAVIVMSHLQNANNEITVMIPGLTGVDLVISGGGHELMTDPDDSLINGGVAATFTTHPVYTNDAAAQPVPLVTGHFGNRYVGEVNAVIDDVTGNFTIGTTHMIRVSGKTTAPTDADAVTGDTVIFNDVVTPVRNFIAALNAQIIGTTNIRLNADRAGASAPRNYLPGIRKSETNLGNLVADAMRFAGEADVAIQNGGGVRTSVAGPGNVTEGDTFNVLPFTNLVKRAPVMNAAQLKAIFEHGFGGANTTPTGAEEGRYPQVSGVQVIYDSTRTAGSRVRRIVLTNNTATTADDTLLVDYGLIVNPTTTFSFSTIDFTAAGGDGYPFAQNNVVFENSPFTISYQEALSEYIQTPVVDGGLGGVIDSNLNPEYAAQNIFDRYGRIIDMQLASTGRDTITGTAGGDLIQGGPGADVIDGGLGADTFIYTDARDGGDTINNFALGSDKLDVKDLLASLGAPMNASALGTNITFTDVTGGALVSYVLPGGSVRSLVTVKGAGVNAAALNSASNFVF